MTIIYRLGHATEKWTESCEALVRTSRALFREQRRGVNEIPMNSAFLYFKTCVCIYIYIPYVRDE